MKETSRELKATQNGFATLEKALMQAHADYEKDIQSLKKERNEAFFSGARAAIEEAVKVANKNLPSKFITPSVNFCECCEYAIKLSIQAIQRIDVEKLK